MEEGRKGPAKAAGNGCSESIELILIFVRTCWSKKQRDHMFLALHGYHTANTGEFHSTMHILHEPTYSRTRTRHGKDGIFRNSVTAQSAENVRSTSSTSTERGRGRVTYQNHSATGARTHNIYTTSTLALPGATPSSLYFASQPSVSPHASRRPAASIHASSALQLPNGFSQQDRPLMPRAPPHNSCAQCWSWRGVLCLPL